VRLVYGFGGRGPAPAGWGPPADSPAASLVRDYLIARQLVPAPTPAGRFWSSFVFRFGFTEVGGRLAPREGAALRPGRPAAAELALDAPIVAEDGARFTFEELYSYEDWDADGPYFETRRCAAGLGAVTGGLLL
jgi:hypothetical protein